MKNTNSTHSRKFRLTSEEKFLIFIILTVLIGLLVRCYGNYLIKKTTEEVITSAVLVESSDEGYTLSFEGEEYYYTFN